MIPRALPGAVLVVAGLAGIVAIGRSAPPEVVPYFASASSAWMPSVHNAEVLTGSWFCPGVPASGEEGVGGDVVIANRDDEPLSGRFSILTPDGVAVDEPITVDAWARAVIAVDERVTATYASVVVELDGGRGVVEQVAHHPAGDAVAPCANDTSDTWYLADGFTVDGSVETLVLTNPYEEAAVVNLSFASETGETNPAAFQGFTILPRSVEVVPIAELGNREEPVIGVSVRAERGRIVMGRAQHYLGGGRLGYTMTLAAAATRDQFWFAGGRTGAGIKETYAIYNPTDDAVDVDVVFLGIPLDSGVTDLTMQVPSRRVLVLDAGDLGDGAVLPEGRHAVVFSTLAAPSIVVERAITTPAGQSVATNVLLGAPPRSDGFVASQWHIGVGPDAPAEAALVVYNVDNVDGTISIDAVGPGGPTPVASLTDLTIGAGAVVPIDLTDPEVLGRELIVRSTNRVFVERALPRGTESVGRSASWALPAAD